MKTHEEFAGNLDVDGVQYPYTGCHRDWNLLPGFTAPKGTVWEVCAENLPFYQRAVAVLGGSKDEALSNLGQALRKIRDHA